jgi:hypothetical protein
LEQCLVGKDDIVASRIVWDAEPVAITANEALAADAAGASAQTAIEGAADWLRAVLADGPMSATEVGSQAEAAGIAQATVRRAKKKVGVIVQRISEGAGGAGRWVWALPESARCSGPPQDAHISDVSTLQKFEHLAAETGDDDLPARRETVL